MNKVKLKVQGNKTLVVIEYEPATAVKASVVITAAMGVKQVFYQKFAQYLSDNGYVVYTFDYMGTGESKLHKIKTYDCNVTSMAENDIETVLKYAKDKNKNIPLLYLGHSVGGQILGMVPSKNLIDGVLFVAVPTGYWKARKGLQKFKMFLFLYILLPLSTKILGYLPGVILGSEDLPKHVAIEWAKWCKSPNYLFDHIDSENNKYREINCPLYSYSTQDDDMASKCHIDWMTEKYTNAKINRIHVKPSDLAMKSIGHFGFFSSKSKKSIWKQFLIYLEKMS